MIDLPDPIPEAMAMPFSDFITTYSLEPLVPLFRELIWGGGLCDFTKLTTYDAFRAGIAPADLESLFLPFGGGGYYSIQGGCVQIYNGMVAYLGAENVVTDANIDIALRPPPGWSDAPSLIAGTAGGVPFAHACKRIIMAQPPTPDNMGFMLPDATEWNVFNRVSHHWYFVTAANVSGPAASGPFALDAYDPTQTWGFPQAPTLTEIFRGYGYGPGAAAMCASVPTTPEEMTEIAVAQLANVPSSYLTSVTLQEPINYHVYAPGFNGSLLTTSPSPYTLFRNLQGHRNTYYGGSTQSKFSHSYIINWSELFVNSTFPIISP